MDTLVIFLKKTNLALEKWCLEDSFLSFSEPGDFSLLNFGGCDKPCNSGKMIIAIIKKLIKSTGPWLIY